MVVPHSHLDNMIFQPPFSSIEDQNQQIMQTALVFQAMLMDLSEFANYEYQTPMHMPKM